MKRWALGTSLQTRRALACSILLAVLACAALPGVSNASKTIRGYGFSTVVPNGWKTGKGKQGTTRVYGAASRKSKRGIAPNTMQLGVSVLPVVELERQLGSKLPSSLTELLGVVMQPPQEAQNVQLTAPFRSSTLAGRPAASGALQFLLAGTTILLSETIAVHRGQVYVVEFDLDLALQNKGLSILKSIHRHWRWR